MTKAPLVLGILSDLVLALIWEYREVFCGEEPSVGIFGRHQEFDSIQRRGLKGNLRGSVWLLINSCFRECENPCFY